MEFQTPFCLFLFLFFTFLSTSLANKFNVGGSQGWVSNPSESYNQWAGRNRFQINDTIVFKYKKGSDSVLEVKKEDYDKCNKTNPIKKFENGDTEFKFDRSGPFYFISGNDGNCEKGQKLIVVVLSPRKPPSPTPPSISPPASPPTSPSPIISPVPATQPPSPTATPPSPSPQATSPSLSPSPAATSPSPAATSPSPPATSPSPAATPPAPSPESSPPAPSPGSSPPAPPPSTVTTPPAPGPGAGPSGSSPSSSSPTKPPGPTGTPQATPSSNSSAPANSGLSVAPSSFLVYSVTIVVGAVMLRY